MTSTLARRLDALADWRRALDRSVEQFSAFLVDHELRDAAAARAELFAAEARIKAIGAELEAFDEQEHEQEVGQDALVRFEELTRDGERERQTQRDVYASYSAAMCPELGDLFAEYRTLAELNRKLIGAAAKLRIEEVRNPRPEQGRAGRLWFYANLYQSRVTMRMGVLDFALITRCRHRLD